MGIRLQELIVPFKADTSGFAKAVTGGVLATVAAVGTAMVSAFVATEKWAGELDSLGDVVDGTTSQIAALTFVARKSGVGVETFTKANLFMEKSLVKTDGSLDVVGKKMAEYGINVKDSNGNVKQQASLIQEVANKYATLSTQQEKVNFLTEIYGKQGADLIDYFDTLNGEGGISAVEDKVKRLGLAIDPSRYEMFNRNLEELKLIGTGLAVTFTEKLMPVLEGALQYVTDFAEMPLEEKLSHLADPLKGLFNLTDAFKRGAAETDWKALSDDIAGRINNIDWNLAGQYVRQGISNVLQGIETIVSDIDWKALGDATGNALKGMVAGLAGYPDWNSFTKGISDKIDAAFDRVRNYTMEDFKSDWAKFIDGLKNAWQNFIEWANNEAAKTPGRNVQGGWQAPTATNNTGRASGGAVTAGQSYNVVEFNKPEVFTPAVNGRISAKSDNTVPINEDAIGKAVGKYIEKLIPVIVATARA